VRIRYQVEAGEEQVDRDRERDMKRKITVLALSTMLFAFCIPVRPTTRKSPRIGFVSGGSATTLGLVGLTAFRKACEISVM